MDPASCVSGLPALFSLTCSHDSGPWAWALHSHLGHLNLGLSGELVGVGKQGQRSSLFSKPCPLEVAPGAAGGGSGVAQGSGSAPSPSRADRPSSLSQDATAPCSTLLGSTWPRSSDSPSPKKEQKEYLITGGCCQPAVSEVLGWALPPAGHPGRPPYPSSALARGLAATSGREDAGRTCLSEVTLPSPGMWLLPQRGEQWLPSEFAWRCSQSPHRPPSPLPLSSKRGRAPWRKGGFGKQSDLGSDSMPTHSQG